jgi:hypothetical protein
VRFSTPFGPESPRRRPQAPISAQPDFSLLQSSSYKTLNYHQKTDILANPFPLSNYFYSKKFKILNSIRQIGFVFSNRALSFGTHSSPLDLGFRTSDFRPKAANWLCLALNWLCFTLTKAAQNHQYLHKSLL